MKNKLFAWLDATFNDIYILYWATTGNTAFNIIHQSSNDNGKMWDVLRTLHPELFFEDNVRFVEEENKFTIFSDDARTKCELMPYDNYIYHTDLMEGNNGGQ